MLYFSQLFSWLESRPRPIRLYKGNYTADVRFERRHETAESFGIHLLVAALRIQPVRGQHDLAGRIPRRAPHRARAFLVSDLLVAEVRNALTQIQDRILELLWDRQSLCGGICSQTLGEIIVGIERKAASRSEVVLYRMSKLIQENFCEQIERLDFEMNQVAQGPALSLQFHLVLRHRMGAARLDRGAKRFGIGDESRACILVSLPDDLEKGPAACNLAERKCKNITVVDGETVPLPANKID